MISVIIPLYNKEHTIAKSIDSVLNQSYRDIELIVVNDGSTDKSESVVRSITDDRLLLITQENGGPSKARNTGMGHAKGEWTVFLDADDELLPNALQTMHEQVKKYPEADLIDFNKYLRIGDELVPQSHPLEGEVKNPLRAWYYRMIAPGCGHSIYRTGFIQRFPYDIRLRRYEDAELLVRMLPQSRTYSSPAFTEIHDMNTAAASSARKSIDEDYLGNLSLRGCNFWQRMCQYRLFIEERMHYPAECRRLYPSWYRRYDLLLLYKLLPYLRPFIYKC